MNKNIMIVLGGAVVIAVAVAFIVQLSLGGQEKAQVVAEEKVEILVAAKKLGIGAELSSGDVRWQDWPKSSVFSGAIVRKGDQDASKILEGRLARNVEKGEPMLASVILGVSAGNFVSASLEPGMRAVSINVSPSSMVAGFIGPGDYVDVILTYRRNVRIDDEDPRVKEMMEKNLDKLAAETLIQNVKVLAVDQTAQRPEENKIKVGKTVTLAVSVEEAEKLSLASQMGDLTLSLRGAGDDVIIKSQWPVTSDARVTAMDDEVFEEYRKIKDDSGNNGRNVRIYNGARVLDSSAQ